MASKQGRMTGREVLRLINRGTTLLRSLQGDPEVDADHVRELRRAATVRKTLDDVARRAVGCVRPSPCDCPMCREAQEEKVHAE